MFIKDTVHFVLLNTYKLDIDDFPQFDNANGTRICQPAGVRENLSCLQLGLSTHTRMMSSNSLVLVASDEQALPHHL